MTKYRGKIGLINWTDSKSPLETKVKIEIDTELGDPQILKLGDLRAIIKKSIDLILFEVEADSLESNQNNSGL